MPQCNMNVVDTHSEGYNVWSICTMHCCYTACEDTCSVILCVWVRSMGGDGHSLDKAVAMVTVKVTLVCDGNIESYASTCEHTHKYVK